MYLLIFAQYLFFSIVSDLEKGVTSKTRALHYAQAVAMIKNRFYLSSLKMRITKNNSINGAR